MKKELICICCPMGCGITVEQCGEKLQITGNACPRGKEYAENECRNPVRTVTSTVMSENSEPIPVKCDRPIPKDKIFECMKIINAVTVKLPVKAGDVVAENVFGSNIIATADRN